MIEKTRKVVVAAVELKHRMLLKVRKIIDFIVWLYWPVAFQNGLLSQIKPKFPPALSGHYRKSPD
jgi:hypothetical protein